MAQYRAVVKGARGEASRLGHKSTGISARVDGWNAGVKVSAHHDEPFGDVFTVSDTLGSKSGENKPRLRIVEFGSEGATVQVFIHGDWYSLDWVERETRYSAIDRAETPISAEDAEKMNEAAYNARYDELRI